MWAFQQLNILDWSFFTCIKVKGMLKVCTEFKLGLDCQLLDPAVIPHRPSKFSVSTPASQVSQKYLEYIYILVLFAVFPSRKSLHISPRKYINVL